MFMQLQGQRKERGATMLAALCFSSVIAISLAGYVTVSYSAMQQAQAQAEEVAAKIEATNTLEETLHNVSSADLSDWTVDGDTATRVVTDLDIDSLLETLPFTFDEELKVIPPPRPEPAVVDPWEAMMRRFRERMERSSRTNSFGLLGMLSYGSPETVVEDTVETAEAVVKDIIDPNEITMTLTGLSAGSTRRELSLIQRDQRGNGAIHERILTAEIEALHPIHNALVARGLIRLRREGVIDSYDSSLGAYSDENRSYDAVVASNRVIVHRAEVRGYASASGRREPTFGRRASLLGPDTDEEVDVDPARVIAFPFQPDLATTAASGVGTALPAPGTVLGQVDSSVARIYYASDLALSGDAFYLVIGPTILVVDGDLTLQDSANIQIADTASLEIHVSGNVNLGGQGILNGSALPARCAVIGTSDADTAITVNTATPFHGVIYSPQADLTVRGDDRELFGAILADRILFDGRTSFHFDRDLKNAYFNGIETAFVFGMTN